MVKPLLVFLALAGIVFLAECDDVRLDGGKAGWSNRWYVQVDGVMGGRSSGYLKFENGAMVFSGNINLIGGGFSSVRRSLSRMDLSNYAGIVVEVESKAFSRNKAPLGLHLQLKDARSSWGYAAAFAIPFAETSTETARLFLPLTSFDRASRGGRSCSSCALDTSRVDGVDVYVLFQEGSFEVRIRSIVAVQRAQTSSVPVISLSPAASTDLLRATLNSGGSVYDKGYREICIALYTSSLNSVLVAQGPSSAIKGVACAGLNRAAQSTSKTDKAWDLRDTLDAILADLQGRTRGSRQNWLPMGDDAIASLASCKTSSDSSGSVITPPKEEMTQGNTQMQQQTSASEALNSFEGPFTGMGISGYNDLGQAMVDDPATCAKQCLRDSRCKSFDYGARGQVAGECWFSTATRASAGSAYSVWELYDLYELSDEKVSDRGGNADRGKMAGGGDTDASSESSTRSNRCVGFQLLGTIVFQCICYGVIAQIA